MSFGQGRAICPSDDAQAVPQKTPPSSQLGSPSNPFQQTPLPFRIESASESHIALGSMNEKAKALESRFCQDEEEKDRCFNCSFTYRSLYV
jgi:hypothetical protein